MALSYARGPGFGGGNKKKTPAPAAATGGAAGFQQPRGNAALQESLKSKPQPEGPGDDFLSSLFSSKKKPATLSPQKDPTKNPETESEHVKGAVYTEVKGKPFLKGAGDDQDIKANDASQGQLGDCYFIASLAAIAHRSPETLRKMITENSDGTYTVHFNEGGDVVVDGRFPTKNGDIQFAGAGDETTEGKELWVMLIEKAWAKLKGGYELIRGSKVRMSSNDAMEAMSGKETREFNPGNIQEDVFFEKMKEAQDKGWPATLGVRNQTDAAQVKASKDAGLVPNHAYAILSVDVKGKTVEVYNPWGAEYKVPPLKFDVIKKFVSVVHINRD